MVLNKAMAPSSKLAMEERVSDEVVVKGLHAVQVHQLYRAMDFLLESADEVQRSVFTTVANLFNLEARERHGASWARSSRDSRWVSTEARPAR